MKIRNGFVSNSSSSSFAIFGKIFTSDKFAERFKFTEEEVRTALEDGIDDKFERKLGGLDYIYIDEEVEMVANANSWLVGFTLCGDSKEICEDMKSMDGLFGPGCTLYTGIDDQSTGKISFYR